MNRRNGGFSITEMLFTCLILSLTGGLILQTLNLAIRQIRARSADSAAEILCNELAVAVRDQLSYATGVNGADSASEKIDKPAFASSANGLNGVTCVITAEDERGIDTGRVRFRYTKDGQSFDFFPLGDTSAHLKWLTPQELVVYSYKPRENMFHVEVTVKDADGYSEEEHKREFEVKPIRNIMLKPNAAPAIKYAIVWRNSKDGTILKASQLEKGDTISFDQPPPTYSDAQYDYIFDGWNPPLTAGAEVTGDQTYWALFKEPESPKTYTVTWESEGTVLKTETLAYGATPSYDGETPAKPSDTDNNYTFSGWSPSLGPVKGNITYTANFTTELKKYDITWINVWEDDSFHTLLTSQADRNSIPEYPGETPTREPSAKYQFSGWTPALEPATQNKSYYALYTKRSYAITWIGKDGNVADTGTFAYGATPSYNGPPQTDLVYELKWVPDIHSVTGPETYRADFTSTRRKYTITWNNYDDNYFYREEIAYGDKVFPPEDKPTRSDTDEKTFTFSGWTPSIPADGWTVVGPQTFTAQYEEAPKSGA